VQVKTIGIIGGLGPESTIEYYRLILAGYQARKPGSGNPSLIINSVNMKKMLDWITVGKLDEIADYLVAEIQRLANAGADVGLISANTPHIVFNRVQEKSTIPLISIVEVTCQAAKEMGLKKLALFGAKFTMQGNFYPAVFYKNGIELVVPAPEEQDYIHEKYFGELVVGKVFPETLQRMLAIVERMKHQQGVDGLVLGGTELSLIFREPTASGVPVLDTTRIHVNRIVAELLS
jgi:aspartate racemase